MVHFFAISIFLIPIVTVLGSQFWHDVDKLFNELSAPQDLPTQTTTNEVHQVESTPPVPHHSPSPNETDERQLVRQWRLSRKFYQKNITVKAAEVELFKQTIIIDNSYPRNTTLEEIENKLLVSGSLHEWFDLDTYDIDKYSKYWVKVCVLFWGQPAITSYRYSCSISVSYGFHKKRPLTIRGQNLYLDMLYCKCHTYETNYRIPLSTPETFLVHKSGQNEFYIFGLNSQNLIINAFYGGISLPRPADEKHAANLGLRSMEKYVTLGANDIELFNQSLNIVHSYPENISLAELEKKLMEFEEIHHWSDLYKYNLDTYSVYWANLCVLLWGKQLDNTHRQACVLSTSYGGNKIRKLFIRGRILHYDLLYCKCHSYLTNFRNPVSSADIYLIHRSNANEFFVFDQRATSLSQFTLFIKGFKHMTNLPDPEGFI